MHEYEHEVPYIFTSIAQKKTPCTDIEKQSYYPKMDTQYDVLNASTRGTIVHYN